MVVGLHASSKPWDVRVNTSLFETQGMLLLFDQPKLYAPPPHIPENVTNSCQPFVSTSALRISPGAARACIGMLKRHTTAKIGLRPNVRVLGSVILRGGVAVNLKL